MSLIPRHAAAARRAPALRAAACLLAMAALQACASHPPAPSAEQEARDYQAHARGAYVPPGPPEDPWGPYINEASDRFDVPDLWIRQVMHVESGGNLYRNGELITSNVGAMGLMQVMPQTYDELRDRYSLGDDPFNPHDNILAGTAYLREMYDIYGSPGFLAAYNAGPRRLDDYLSNARPLPDETRRYVAMIAPYIAGAAPRAESPAQQYAMNQIPDEIPPGLRYGRPVQVASARGAARPRTAAAESWRAKAVQMAKAERAHDQQPIEVAYAPPARGKPGFHLIAAANAAEPARLPKGPQSKWAIQVKAPGRAEPAAHDKAATEKARAGKGPEARAPETRAPEARTKVAAADCKPAHGRAGCAKARGG